MNCRRRLSPYRGKWLRKDEGGLLRVNLEWFDRHIVDGLNEACSAVSLCHLAILDQWNFDLLLPWLVNRCCALNLLLLILSCVIIVYWALKNGLRVDLHSNRRRLSWA